MTGLRSHFIITLLFVPALGFAAAPSVPEAPATLSFDNLVTLASVDPIPAPLQEKLDKLLSTPFISNEAKAHGVKPLSPRDPILGPVLRVVEWNINRGENEPEVQLALTHPDDYLAAARKNPSIKKRALSRVDGELKELSAADVIILDEVDNGVNRTNYHDVARNLAAALDMNYVYGVEFIELDRIYLGFKEMDEADRPNRHSGEIFGLDPKRYLGLEGSAILSRYPIRSARMVRLPEKYDWYHQEIKAISDVEKARRWTSEQLFQERIARQVRRGGRMAIVADLEVPQSPTGIVTVVSPHLEDYTRPEGRRAQLSALLDEIKNVSNPVILTGDFNTTGSSARPITVRREILKYVKDYRFWARQILFLVIPVPGLGYAFNAVNYFKNFHDPTAFNVPIILGNRSLKLFHELETYRFSDGGQFDFGGRRGTSYRHTRTLANSNQRGWKGFTPTFAFRRNFKGLVGRYKIDWFFIKPSPVPTESAKFAPHFGRTLQLVNDSLDPRISDHCPITATLPLDPPATTKRKRRN